MLGVPLRDHINNRTLRQVSGVKDIVVNIRESKNLRAGHVDRLAYNLWVRHRVISVERKRSLDRFPRR